MEAGLNQLADERIQNAAGDDQAAGNDVLRLEIEMSNLDAPLPSPEQSPGAEPVQAPAAVNYNERVRPMDEIQPATP
ncbi:hypothetical protein MMC13_002634 [Lambiella insularis]|nr:hypothetical protein [Lambiella insularis]